MNTTKILLRGEYIDFNSYQEATRRNRFIGSKIKKQETERAYWECMDQKIKPVIGYPVDICFKWYSKDNRKDIDNVAFAKKFILDGLVMAGVIENDSRKFVRGFSDEFLIDKTDPRVEIEII